MAQLLKSLLLTSSGGSLEIEKKHANAYFDNIGEIWIEEPSGYFLRIT